MQPTYRHFYCCVSSATTKAFCIPCRQFQFRVGAGNFCSVHVSLVPVLGVVGEQKTKPTQHSVAVLRSLGINPHLLACRSSEPLEQAVKVKLVSPCPSVAACVACHCSEAWAAQYNLASRWIDPKRPILFFSVVIAQRDQRSVEVAKLRAASQNLLQL